MDIMTINILYFYSNLVRAEISLIMLFFIPFFFISSVLGLYTVPPTWITSNLVRAGNRNVINTLTGSSSTPTYTFTFSSSLTGIPYLGYGIKSYEGSYRYNIGSDFLGQ